MVTGTALRITATGTELLITDTELLITDTEHRITITDTGYSVTILITAKLTTESRYETEKRLCIRFLILLIYKL